MTIDVRDKLVDPHIHVHSPDIAEVSAGAGIRQVRPLVPVDDAGGLRRLL